MKIKTLLNPHALQNLVRQAIAEDVGSGDVTTNALIAKDLEISGFVRTRENCIIAGLPVFKKVYEELDSSVQLSSFKKDGDSCEAGSTIATVSGSARSILIGERTALNFIQRLSGISTLTHAFVTALGDSKTKILDTRKTTPSLRFLEKYAVLVGGGTNHRMGLYDRIMIKDNHLFITSLEGRSDIRQLAKICREQYPGIDLEVELDQLDQLSEALEADPEYILLDNMSTAEMIQAIKMRDSRNSKILLEASGGITLEKVKEIATIGLDFISVGTLTHSPKSIDIALDLNR